MPDPGSATMSAGYAVAGAAAQAAKAAPFAAGNEGDV